MVLNEIGWRISILKGGYKDYRKLVLDELNDLSKYQFKILQGQTGSAKTKILNCLYNMNAQVIDLENLAESPTERKSSVINDSKAFATSF